MWRKGEQPVRPAYSPTRLRDARERRERNKTLDEQIAETKARHFGAAQSEGSQQKPDAFPDSGSGSEVAVLEEPAPAEVLAEPTAVDAELQRQQKAIDEEQRMIGRELREKGMAWIRKREPEKLTEALAMVREGARLEREAAPVVVDRREGDQLLIERTRWLTVNGRKVR